MLREGQLLRCIAPAGLNDPPMSLSLTRDAAPRPLTVSQVRFVPERAEDATQVETLIDRAFGPGRFAKTAERLREGGVLPSRFSTCAWRDELLAGAVRLWPARIGDRAAIFLGPIAVEPGLRRLGLGATLVEQACARAAAEGEGVVILVGDFGLFGPLGFEPTPPGRVVPPGPVNPARLLWKALSPGDLGGLEGALRPASPA